MISKYLELRPQIRSGDILLCSGTEVFSKMIQKATSSEWSHVAFILEIKEINRIMVLESVEDIGVRTVPLSSYLTNYNNSGTQYPGKLVIARHKDFKATMTQALSRQAVDLLGAKYNTEDILKISARIVAHTLGLDRIVNDKPITLRKEFICSEYVYLCFKSIGIEIPYDLLGFIAPKDFAGCSDIKEIGNLN